MSSSAVSVHTFQGIDPFHTFVMDTRWNSFPITSYMRAAPPNPLSPPQHTSEKPLIARSVPPLYVHSSPSSPSANCTPSADATITRTRSTSCFCLSDEEALTTVDSHHRHLPYCHARLAIPLSDETCRIVLNPYAHISIRSPSKDSSASKFSPALDPASRLLPPLVSIGIDGRDGYWDLLFCCGINILVDPSMAVSRFSI